MNIDLSEIDKFGKLKNSWWDPEGDLKTLHDINPLRLQYILSKGSLKEKKILDVGCGGGILAEEMAKLGGYVTGIDMSEEALNVARHHQAGLSNPVDYRLTTAEDLSALYPASYDMITCLELLEHVPDPRLVIQACSVLLKPNGHVFFSTLNRTVKAYVFAIVGAEYLLKMIPKNTHDFEKFIRPSELAAWTRDYNLNILDIVGLSYHPLSKKYSLTKDITVNYIVHLKKM